MSISEKSVEIRYFSGYIRNWRKLCAELGIEQDLSRAEREAEIIKKAYIKWNTSMQEHLCGMFAIAVYDEIEGKLFFVRDQVGQKQMFYSVIEGELVCSGDIDEIASTPGFEKRLNKRMLQQYLFYGYPIGEETFYEGIFKLMPGHFGEWNGEEVKISRYFMPAFKPDRSKSVDEFAKEIEDVVCEILSEEKGDPEFPYKESFLSGGVDSSYLLAAGDAVCANTVGYEESGYDESALARHTAELLGKDFRVKMISPEEYFERIPTVIDKMGQPLGDASAVAFSIGCKAVKEHADVVYSGEGIDEFFGGYNAHKREIPKEWTYLTCSHIMSEQFIKELLNDYDDSVKVEAPIEKLWSEVQGQEELDKKLTVDISLWLEGDIYLNTDRTSTACGIELHTPFSDVRLFNVASRIPAEYKFMNDQNKYAFRKAASGLLPDEVAFRKKVGFPVPVRKWLKDERFNKPIEEKLFSDTSKKFFDQEVIKDMWERYLGGEDLLWNRVYAVYAFLIWYDLKF